MTKESLFMENIYRPLTSSCEWPEESELAGTRYGVPGRKDDHTKLDLTLLFDDCPHALEAIAEVLQWAVVHKQPVPYKRGSWQAVEPFQARYRAASMRHELNAAKAVIAAKLNGAGDPIENQRDPETGLLELAHIATNAVFRLEMAIRKLKGAA
jgi:hypothetical protein